MRSRKYFDPVASQEFFNVLNNINVPKDLVRNEEGWKKVTQKGKGEDFVKGVREMRDLMRTTTRSIFLKGGKGRGKRKKPSKREQKGGNQRLLPQPFTPVLSYPEEWYKIKRRASQKGKGELRKIPNWECYKG